MGVRASVKFTYKGKELTLYYMNALSEATGRNAQTLRKWELAGIIPKTPFRDKTGKRLYLQEHIDAVAESAEKCQIGQGRNMSSTQFKEQVYKKFKAINEKYSLGV